MSNTTRALLPLCFAVLLAPSCQENDKISPDPAMSPAGASAGVQGGASGGPAGGGPAGAAGRSGATGGEASAGAGQGAAAGAAGSSAGTEGGGEAGAQGGGKAGAGGDDAAGQAGAAGGTPDAAGASGQSGAGGIPSLCPTDLPGAKLVEVRRADGRAACIDQRETTQGEYHAFIQKVGGKEGFQKLGFCEPGPFYSDPEPNGGADDVPVYGACNYGAYTPETTPDAPVGCLDRCQAAAYCAWADKELCGGFDDDETLSAKDIADPAKSIWANACTNGGTTDVSHESAKTDACGPPRKLNQAQTEPVTSYAECHGQGAYAGIYNLSGGVAEWVNAQLPPAREGGKPTWLRIGPQWGTNNPSACGSANWGQYAWGVGFRCCKRLPAK